MEIAPKRIIGRPFLPGNVANPSGRPKSDIGQMVRQMHGNGERLAQLFTEVAFLEGQFAGARIPLPVRLEAANWLADRGWGKPAQSVDIKVDMEARVRSLAIEIGLDPEQAVLEATNLIEGGKQ